MPNTHVPAAATGLPNRRLFLAAGSAGAVFGALSHAVAAPAVSPELLDLIEAHRAADAARLTAADEVDAAEERFCDLTRDLDFGAVFKGFSVNVFYLAEARERLLGLLDRERTHAQTALMNASQSFSPRIIAAWDEFYRDTVAHFDSLAVEVEAKRKESQLDEIESRRGRAIDAEDAALAKICAWPCASIGDLRAQCDHLLGYVDTLADEELRALFRSFAGLSRVEG